MVEEARVGGLSRSGGSPSSAPLAGGHSASTSTTAPKARTGQKARLFFGVGGPNVTSNFHLIGEIFDRLYLEGDLLSLPRCNVQTTLVPSGGAALVEFEFAVPGTYILVDHALTRAVDKGALRTIVVEGPEQPELFSKIG